MKAADTINVEHYKFRGLWDIPSECGLKIYKTGRHNVVIVSELYRENPGTMITDVPVQLATQICNEYLLDPDTLVYIEHNPKTVTKLSFYEEEFFRVRFTITDGKPGNAEYEKISQADLETILSINN
jgi:hypothetical protein